MQLPTVERFQLSPPPRSIDWMGLPTRYLHPGELEVIVALVKSAQCGFPRTMIEFGVNHGRTAKIVLHEVKALSRYVGVDVMPGYVPGPEVQKDEVPRNPGYMAKDDERFELILRPRGTLDLSPSDLPRADVIFVDGDHGRQAVLYDTQLATNRAKPGGIIIWHDYHDLGTVDVKEVLDELRAYGRDIKHVHGTWLAFERQPPLALESSNG